MAGQTTGYADDMTCRRAGAGARLRAAAWFQTALLMWAMGAGIWPSLSWAVDWALVTPFPATSLPVVNAQRFANDLQALSAGRLRILIGQGAAAPAHANIKAAVSSGRAQMGEFMLATNRTEHEVFAVDAIPFLAISPFNVRKLWSEAQTEIRARLLAQGVELLFVTPLPAPGLLSTRPIGRLSDLRGMRFWAPDSRSRRFAQLVGAVPVASASDYLPRAFANGEVTAMFASPQAAQAMQAWQFAPNFLSVLAWVPKSAVVANHRAIKALPKRVQAALAQVVTRSQERAWRTWTNQTEAALANLSARGVAVQPASSELRQAFLGVGQTLTVEWTAVAGDTGIGIIDRFKALQ